MDWTNYLADVTRRYGDEWSVYSDANPSRVWTGERTIEFGRRGSTTTPYISGDASTTTELTLFTRCDNESDAEAAAWRVYQDVVRVALDALVKTEKIRGYTIERVGTFADERGAAIIGESFSGFVDFTIYEETYHG